MKHPYLFLHVVHNVSDFVGVFLVVSQCLATHCDGCEHLRVRCAHLQRPNLAEKKDVKNSNDKFYM